MFVRYLDTKASEKISARINNKSFIQDVKKMSPKYQTSACEAFHSVVIHFAPKSTAFSYKGMLSRCVSKFLVFQAVDFVYKGCT